jgi:ankyrin repeat protein
MSVSVLRQLPPRPSVDQLRRQARDLQRQARAGESAAVGRVRDFHPHAHVELPNLKLSDAQLVLAREYGFPSWPRLKAHVQLSETARTRPYRIFEKVPYYEERAEGIRKLYEQGLDTVREVVRERLPRFAATPEGGDNGALTSEDARLVVARQHGCDSWEEFTRRVEAVHTQNGTNEPFRVAYQALQERDEDRLRKVLRAHRGLVNERGSNGHSLLNLAVSIGDPALVRVLLAAGADPNLPGDRGFTPLHGAACGKREIAALLLEAGASPAATAYGDGGTPLVMALFWGCLDTADQSEFADFLAEHGITPLNLRVAAGLGRLDLLRAFLRPDGSLTPEAGAHRDFYRPHYGFHPSRLSDDPQEILDEALTYAARSGRTEACAWLLQHGADINGEPYNGTALHWASGSGRVPLVRWLVGQGADLNRRARFGGVSGVTPLHVASAWNGRFEVVKALVELGADVHPRDPDHHSPPWGWAGFFGNTEIRDLLREVAAREDPFAAVSHGDPERLREALARNPEQVNRNDAWTTPLGAACASGRLDLIEILVAHGADPNLRALQGQLPLEAAPEERRAELAARLAG